MNPQPPFLTPAFVWRWLWTSAAGCFVGTLIGFIPQISWVIMTDGMGQETPNMGFWFGLVAGASIGFFSSRGPQELLKRQMIRRVRWKLSSTIGGAVGMSLLLSLIDLLIFSDSLPRSAPSFTRVIYSILPVSLFGLIMGVAQFLALRQARRFNRNLYLWPFISAIAYVLAVAVLFAGYTAPELSHYGLYDLGRMLGLASYVISPMIVVAITAAGMVWILARQEEARATVCGQLSVPSE